jgi:hypothetical protein
MSVTIHKATRGSLGRVVRGDEIPEADAVREYAAGRDVVVCGDDIDETRAVAQRIAAAFGPYQPQFPHTRTAGPYALPHYQPARRSPIVHAFYETARKKAARNP